MIKRNHIRHLLFLSCWTVLILNLIWSPSGDPNVDFYKMLFFTFPSIYILVYVSHLITIQYFAKLKEFLYTNRLKGIEKIIADKKRPIDELGVNFVPSILINFFVLFFLATISPKQLLTKLPGMENVEVEGLSETVSLLLELLRMPSVEYLAPFTVSGLVIIYILKFLHRRKITNLKIKTSENNKKYSEYPGSTALLAFIYSMLAVMVIQPILIIFGGIENGPTISEYAFRVFLAALLAAMGSFSIIIAVLADHFLFSKVKPDNHNTDEHDE